MKICIAQTKPVKGDIPYNILQHKKLIAIATSYKADAIIFPELSLTGYEPTLAKALATTQEDIRFNDFQEISDREQIIIGLGAPTKNTTDVYISLILFTPHKARQTYSKKYLHPDEEPFFNNGQNLNDLEINKTKIALAICYELSIPEHAENAFKNGAEVYIASVAKSANGVENASKNLSDIASKYSMTVFMSNSIGHCDNFESAGKTSVWNKEGLLTGQLNETHEGILIFDTATQELIEKTI